MRAVTTSLLVVTAVAGISVGTAQAQPLVIARVPFAFMVRDQQFPAGTYEVRADEGFASILTIHSENNRKAAAFVFADPAAGSDPAGDRPALVFHRVGSEYRLSQVWESSDEGQNLPAPKGKADRASLDDPEVTYVIAADWK